MSPLDLLNAKQYRGREFDEQRRLHVMPTFRCSSFDDKDHIQSAEVIDAKALGDAIEKGLILPRRSRNQSLEIWDGITKVFPVSALSAAADS